MYRINNQKGFTLIELMIVVAILGILAAIAIPSYRDYTIRTKVGDMLSAASAIRLTSTEYRMSQGAFAATGTANIFAEIGGKDPKNISPYLAATELATTPDSIIVKLCGSTSNLGLTSGETLDVYLFGEFVDEGVDWTCHFASNAADPTRLVPPNCRNIYPVAGSPAAPGGANVGSGNVPTDPTCTSNA